MDRGPGLWNLSGVWCIKLFRESWWILQWPNCYLKVVYCMVYGTIRYESLFMCALLNFCDKFSLSCTIIWKLKVDCSSHVSWHIVLDCSFVDTDQTLHYHVQYYPCPHLSHPNNNIPDPNNLFYFRSKSKLLFQTSELQYVKIFIRSSAPKKLRIIGYRIYFWTFIWVLSSTSAPIYLFKSTLYSFSDWFWNLIRSNINNAQVTVFI